MEINSKLFKEIALDIFEEKEDFICLAIKYPNQSWRLKNKKEFKFFTEMFCPNDMNLDIGGPWFGDCSSIRSRNARVLACLFCYEILKGEK